MEQNVCEQDVIIGVLKNSLQTWHRSPESTEDSLDRGVAIQSVESVTSSSLDGFEAIVGFTRQANVAPNSFGCCPAEGRF